MLNFKFRSFVAFITMLALTVNPVLAQTVVFGRSDYEELGKLEKIVLPAFDQLAEAKQEFTASVKYVELAVQAISMAGEAVNPRGKLSEIASAVDAMNDILGAASADSMSELANSFSAVDTSQLSSSLRVLNSSLSALDAQVSNPIEPPTLLLTIAVRVSNRARQEATSLLEQAISGRSNLQSASASITTYLQLIRKLSVGARQASRLGYEITARLFKLAGENPATSLIIKGMLEMFIPLENQFQEIAGEADSTVTRLLKVQSQIELRGPEIDDLIVTLQSALSAPQIHSTWTTSADTGPANAFYQLSFENRAFTHPTMEIDGEFPLGNLSITNYITQGGGDQTTTATIRFEIERRINDSLLGMIPTPGVADFTMYYTATQNTDDPRASADYFTIPALGINIHIHEEETVKFIIKGRYSSPLRIVAIELAPGSTGGFITEIMPADHIPPVTTAQLSGEKGDNGWYRSAVEVNLHAVDNGGPNETAATYFSLDGGVEQLYQAPFKLTLDGKHNLRYWSVDKSGNREPSQKTDVFIDGTPPMVHFGRAVSRNGFAPWASSSAEIPFLVTDNLSGVASKTPDSPLQLTGEGRNQTAMVTARDAAGNLVVVSSPGVNIDDTPPQINALAHAVITPPAAKSSIQKESNILINVVGSIRDELSGAGPGIGSYELSDNFGNLYPGGSFEVRPDGSFLFPIRLKLRGDRKFAKDHKILLTLTGYDQARNADLISVLTVIPE